MPKKKSTTLSKTTTKKKSTIKKVVEKKTKSSSQIKEDINPSDFLQKENENQLKAIITKEFDKDLTEKSLLYIKSFVKIEDSIISVNDFLNYVENLDEDLFKLFKAYSNSSDNDNSSSSDESEEEEKPSGVKSDDPVRMYLKEMGNVELLSREGEIAIAKRIESGLDRMMNSILECPASLDILKKWMDQVKLQEINLREIVDFDEYFNEDNDPYSNSSKRKEIQKIINDKKKALLKEKEQLMKEQGIEIDKEKLAETASEDDVENESFSISIIEEFYKPEILKKLDRVLVLSENITKIKKNKNITKISDTKSLKDLKKYQDEILNYFKHISANSMGSDFADINNDLQPDLIVLDMLAEDHIRSKENMATMSTENFNALVDIGYHHQYMSNMLQLNNGNTTFSEIGQLAGIAKTDWSWSPLIADFDNDGFQDLFVTNGIEHDLSNQDFRNQMKANIRARKKVSLDEAITMMPSTKLSNYIFKNNRDLTFTNNTQQWGLNTKINSCGAVYADLDNDGDLDLIVNNQSEEASVYKNNSTNNYINFTLEGADLNRVGIGTTVTIYADTLQQTKTLYVSRGYQSSVTNKLHFGLEQRTKIDSVKVVWPNTAEQKLTDIVTNKNITLNFTNATLSLQKKSTPNSLFETIDPQTIGINYQQVESPFDDFELQLLLPQKQSERSTPLAIADVNNDGLEDFFVGNSKHAKAALFIQKKGGTFRSSNEFLFKAEKKYEDTNALFLDIDNDNDMDLYVTSGGYEVAENSPLLQDRLYINDGEGKYTKSNALPEMHVNTKAVCSADYDNDGDMDLFIGGSVKHGKYPMAETSFLLENKNGHFKDVSKEHINAISELKMVNAAVFTDYDNDGDSDLIVVGEWMPILLFENENSIFKKHSITELQDTSGWYQTIKEVDLDGDGFLDYIIGNWGENNKFHPSKEKPLHIYADDFDHNSSLDIILSKVSKTGVLIPVRGKQCSSDQNNFINNNIKTFKSFASSNIIEIYGEDRLKNATHLSVSNFESLILQNNRNGGFNIKRLPKHAQFSPTLGLETYDINNDGYLDIFGVGNVFEAEVETIRYDASKNYILLGNKNNKYTFFNDSSYFTDLESKAIKKIMINKELHFIILNKNETITILKLRKFL